jgi:hypothetical protein
VAKSSGLGDGLLFGAVDVSGDIQSLSSIATPRSTLDITGINKSAHERLVALQDGSLTMTTFFNPGPAGNAVHTALKGLPRTDVLVCYQRGTALGNASYCMLAKQVDYNPTRGTDGSLTFAVSALASNSGAEWGTQLTAGVRTDTTATNGTGVDFTTVSTAFGWQAYLWVTAFTGTSVTVKIQDSADNSTFADLSGASFTAATGATAQRIQSAGRTDTVRRYLRAVTTGTFTSASFAVSFVRNPAAVNF